MTEQQEFGIGLHCHHDTLVEVVAGYTERSAYIEDQKPPAERPLRKRLFAMIPDELLPGALQPLVAAARASRVNLQPLDTDYQAKRKAMDADYQATWKALYDDYQANLQAMDDDYKANLQAMDAAMERHMPELIALHDRLCPNCPWDGRTIFPQVTP